MDFNLNKRKKILRQLVVALLLLCTIGLPIQNIVLANELSTTEEVITEETESATTAEADTSNSKSMENESVPPSEKEAESTEITSSETVLEESKGLTDMPEVDSSEITEASSATQQSEERPSTKAVTTGTFPNGSTSTWTFDDTTGTLTISGGTLVNPSMSIQNLTRIDVSKITNIVLEDKVFASGDCRYLFYLSKVTNLDLSNLDTSNVTSMYAMFSASSPSSIDLSSFDTSNVTNMDAMFDSLHTLSLDLSSFDTSNVTNMHWMFNYSDVSSLDLSGFDTSQVTNMVAMFRNTDNLTSIDLSNFDTSNVTDMSSMFEESHLTSINLSSFDTSNVTDMKYMFLYSAATSIDLSNFDTSKVTDMKYMFAYSAATSIDLSNFDTSKVTDMKYMFAYSAATSLNLSNFDTSKVTNMLNMFTRASQLQNLTLGSQFKFVTDAALPNPTPTAKYTGKWQNVGNGTVDKPKGTFGGTATELMSTYDGSTMADMYVWQQSFLDVQDSMLMIGDTWNPENNFSGAIDSAGDSVDFNAITVTGSVDTTQPGVYQVEYSYGGMTSTATITVLETMPASWINFFVDGTNIRSIPGSLLSTPEWDLTTGLWDKWNPGTIKVPTDKIPLEPTKQGYVFKGWKDATGTIVDFNTLDLDLNSQHEFNFHAVFEKVNSTNPSVEPPTKPGEGPNVVSPATPGSGGNQPPSNGSGLNVGNTAITSQGNTSPTSPATLQGGKLAKLGENSSLLLQGFGLMLVLSGAAFFLVKRRKMHS
ncbi:BspA family leucine-rich repeat surface protein [Listeria monocytogenes]|nr:BspA family leucine-rich repeat surface protein [Listeria monocytogenes]EAD8590170.1 BspA family leucine-rich repeat surface protein [Listeria monocytogenes]EAD8593434.1 BspA family leucine-rich repeat surface protein [Listeria monocytogenes]EAD8602315.1 BspA family leucine-rich repeat surface protein [Listeria monocytogenes]